MAHDLDVRVEQSDQGLPHERMVDQFRGHHEGGILFIGYGEAEDLVDPPLHLVRLQVQANHSMCVLIYEHVDEVRKVGRRLGNVVSGLGPLLGLTPEVLLDVQFELPEAPHLGTHAEDVGRVPCSHHPTLPPPSATSRALQPWDKDLSRYGPQGQDRQTLTPVRGKLTLQSATAAFTGYRRYLVPWRIAQCHVRDVVVVGIGSVELEHTTE